MPLRSDIRNKWKREPTVGHGKATSDEKQHIARAVCSVSSTEFGD